MASLKEFKKMHPDESPKIIFCNIKYADDFWELIRLCSKGYLFRGHENSDWLLQTSLERRYNSYENEIKNSLRPLYESRRAEINAQLENSLDGVIGEDDTWVPSKYVENNVDMHPPYLRDEFCAIDEYRRLAQLEGKDNIEVLASMQHFGSCTRLLDVTSSIFIALFFAFENYSKDQRAIWAFSENFFTKIAKPSKMLQPNRSRFSLKTQQPKNLLLKSIKKY